METQAKLSGEVRELGSGDRGEMAGELWDEYLFGLGLGSNIIHQILSQSPLIGNGTTPYLSTYSK